MLTADLSVAVVGCGARSVIGLHVPEVRPGARVTAVVDVEPQGRRRGAEIFTGAQVFESTAALIEAGGVDAAIVSTPDHTHADIAADLLSAGIAVYLEKPLATTLEDADRVLRAAAETGTKLYVGHNFRHSGVVRTLREVVQRGEIGEVKAVWVRHFVGNGGDYYFKDCMPSARRPERCCCRRPVTTST